MPITSSASMMESNPDASPPSANSHRSSFNSAGSLPSMMPASQSGNPSTPHFYHRRGVSSGFVSNPSSDRMNDSASDDDEFAGEVTGVLQKAHNTRVTNQWQSGIPMPNMTADPVGMMQQPSAADANMGLNTVFNLSRTSMQLDAALSATEMTQRNIEQMQAELENLKRQQALVQQQQELLYLQQLAQQHQPNQHHVVQSQQYQPQPSQHQFSPSYMPPRSLSSFSHFPGGHNNNLNASPTTPLPAVPPPTPFDMQRTFNHSSHTPNNFQQHYPQQMNYPPNNHSGGLKQQQQQQPNANFFPPQHQYMNNPSSAVVAPLSPEPVSAGSRKRVRGGSFSQAGNNPMPDRPFSAAASFSNDLDNRGVYEARQAEFRRVIEAQNTSAAMNSGNNQQFQVDEDQRIQAMKRCKSAEPPINMSPDAAFSQAAAAASAIGQPAAAAAGATNPNSGGGGGRRAHHRRRKTEELLPHETWLCTYVNVATGGACGKVYRTSSSRSITKHMLQCAHRPPLPDGMDPMSLITANANGQIDAAALREASRLFLANQRRKQKKRRKSSELAAHERWNCPYLCGRFFRSTSTKSIHRHKLACSHRPGGPAIELDKIGEGDAEEERLMKKELAQLEKLRKAQQKKANANGGAAAGSDMNTGDANDGEEESGEDDESESESGSDSDESYTEDIKVKTEAGTNFNAHIPQQLPIPSSADIAGSTSVPAPRRRMSFTDSFGNTIPLPSQPAAAAQMQNPNNRVGAHSGLAPQGDVIDSPQDLNSPGNVGSPNDAVISNSDNDIMHENNTPSSSSTSHTSSPSALPVLGGNSDYSQLPENMRETTQRLQRQHQMQQPQHQMGHSHGSQQQQQNMEPSHPTPESLLEAQKAAAKLKHVQEQLRQLQRLQESQAALANNNNNNLAQQNMPLFGAFANAPTRPPHNDAPTMSLPVSDSPANDATALLRALLAKQQQENERLMEQSRMLAEQQSRYNPNSGSVPNNSTNNPNSFMSSPNLPSHDLPARPESSASMRELSSDMSNLNWRSPNSINSSPAYTQHRNLHNFSQQQQNPQQQHHSPQQMQRQAQMQLSQQQKQQQFMPQTIMAYPPQPHMQATPAMMQPQQPVVAHIPSEMSHNDGMPSTAAVAASTSPATAKKSMKVRRVGDQLPDHERWTCPLRCGKFYKKSSSNSIKRHALECLTLQHSKSANAQTPVSSDELMKVLAAGVAQSLRKQRKMQAAADAVEVTSKEVTLESEPEPQLVTPAASPFGDSLQAMSPPEALLPSPTVSNDFIPVDVAASQASFLDSLQLDPSAMSSLDLVLSGLGENEEEEGQMVSDDSGELDSINAHDAVMALQDPIMM